MGRSPWWTRVAVGAGLLAYAAWATGLETFSTGSTVAVVGGGAVAMAWGMWRRRSGDGRSAGPPAPGGRGGIMRRGLGAWLGLLVVLTTWQMQAFVQEPREDHPTLSAITNEVLVSSPARTLAGAAWLWGAYALTSRPGLRAGRLGGEVAG